MLAQGIEEQPALLKAGQLREYQMHVSGHTIQYSHFQGWGHGRGGVPVVREWLRLQEVVCVWGGEGEETIGFYLGLGTHLPRP